MQPFTFDQSIIAGLLFLLGLLIGMFFLAGGKWKRRYRDEAVRREAAEVELEQLRRDNREFESLRHAAAKAPVSPAMAPPTTTTVVHEEVRTTDTPPLGGPYRQSRPSDGDPDLVIRRP